MKKTTFILCLIMALFSSCKKSGDGLSFLPVSSGRPYEILLVIDKAMYERPAGRALHDVLTSDVPGLPQHEAQFRITTCAMEHFDRTFKIFRNIIVVNINPNIYTQTRFKFIRDLNATPQMIMTINSPSEQEMSDYVYSHGKTIIDFFVKAELNRSIKLLERSHSEQVASLAKEMFGCDVWVPSDLTSIKKGNNFFWASQNGGNQLNFCMYSYPYTSSKIFTPEYFVQMRDSFMAANIPGSQPGMHMATQKYNGQNLVEGQHIVVHHQFAQEVRGLWEMTNDNMGGPFVSHVRVDTVNQKVIVAEGFVYYPNEPRKRNHIRRLESALYTLQLPSETVEALSAEGVEEENEDNINGKLKNVSKDKQRNNGKEN